MSGKSGSGRAAEPAHATDAVVIAVDLGGSSMKGAIVSDLGRTLFTETRSTPAFDVVDGLVELLRHLADTAAAHGHPVAAAGVVTPGIVDEVSGSVVYASNLDWRDVPLLDLLRHASRFRSRWGTTCWRRGSRSSCSERPAGRRTSSSFPWVPASPQHSSLRVAPSPARSEPGEGRPHPRGARR